MGGIKKRKTEKRLERRVKAYEEHGPYPNRNNPGKEGPVGTGHIMHKPGGKR